MELILSLLIALFFWSLVYMWSHKKDYKKYKADKKKKIDNKFPKAYYRKEVDRIVIVDEMELDDYERSLS